MAIPIVPNLHTFSFIVPTGTIIKLAADRHRTFFSIGKTLDKPSDVGHLWVGLNPPVNVADWVPLSTDTTLGIRYEYGVYGPIYIAVTGTGDGRMLIISNLDEPSLAEELVVVQNTTRAVSIPAPELYTRSIPLPTGTITELVADPDRTRLLMQHTAGRGSTAIWVGPNPDPDLDNWLHALDTDSGVIDLESGAYGPIFLAAIGALDGRVTIVSNVIETPVVTQIP
jgi:hypothetical protein